MNEDYYKAPSDEIFEDIKSNSIKIWNTYDNTYGYVDEKVDRVKDLKNVSDNWMVMFSMFDHINQSKLLSMVSRKTAKHINRVMKKAMRDI